MSKVEKFLKTKEVAEWLNVSPRTVLQWHHESKLPATRVSAKVLRFKQSDVEQFIKGNN